MRQCAMWIGVMGVTLALGACGDSGSNAPTTAPSSTTQQVTQDLRDAGQKIKDAASAAASNAGPALEKAKEEGRQAVHDLSQKIADSTAATAPAKQP